LRTNRDIRAVTVRVIDSKGEQAGIMSSVDALRIARDEGLDLVEISPNAKPPVCKIIDYGKFRYQQTKRDKENKKSQHQVKVKEVKVKSNIDQHDRDFKLKNARSFILKGNKVKITCTFRGREMAYTDNGRAVVNRMCDDLSDLATPEAPPKMMGRSLSVVLAPGVKKKMERKDHGKNENK